MLNQRELLKDLEEGRIEEAKRKLRLWEDHFIITSVHRGDIKSEMPEIDTDQIDDKKMERLAERMGDDYVEYGSFWSDLKNLLPKILEEE